MIMNAQDLLKDHQNRHSATQMDWFITGMSGGLTPYGQYKQCLRELDGRARGIRDYMFKLELSQIDLDEMTSDAKHKSGFAARRHAVDAAKKIIEIEEMQKSLQMQREEYEHFLGQAKRLKEIVGDISDKGKRDEIDKQAWMVNIKVMAVLDILTTGALSRNTVSMLMSMPKGERKTIVESISKPKHELIHWLDEQDCLMLPDQGESNAILCDIAPDRPASPATPSNSDSRPTSPATPSRGATGW